MRDSGLVVVFLIGLILAVVIGLAYVVRTYQLPDLTRVTTPAIVVVSDSNR